jgi:hypothetical protein
LTSCLDLCLDEHILGECTQFPSATSVSAEERQLRLPRGKRSGRRHRRPDETPGPAFNDRFSKYRYTTYPS